ncbi:hypothetical protein Ddc_06344 [Ditylenchus destructor]|nr:hypothetical protein Ddc_06344 [Ditylenchus destructor]
MTNKEVISSHRRFAVPIIFGQREMSRLGGRKQSSSACTIISLKLAENVYRNGIVFPNLCESKFSDSCFFVRFLTKLIGFEKETKLTCPGRLVNCMANSILEDGFIYEIDHCSLRGTLTDDFPELLISAICSEHLSLLDQLYFLLIAVHRCVVIVYNKNTETLGLMDSHDHPPHGAIIVCTPLGNLHQFACWMQSVMFEELNFIPDTLQFFELSCVYFSYETTDSMDYSSADTYRTVPQLATDERIFVPRAIHQTITSEFVAQAERELIKFRLNRKRALFRNLRTRK